MGGEGTGENVTRGASLCVTQPRFVSLRYLTSRVVNFFDVPFPVPLAALALAAREGREGGAPAVCRGNASGHGSF